MSKRSVTPPPKFAQRPAHLWDGPTFTYHHSYTFIISSCKRVNLEVLCLEHTAFDDPTLSKLSIHVGPIPATTILGHMGLHYNGPGYYTLVAAPTLAFFVTKHQSPESRVHTSPAYRLPFLYDNPAGVLVLDKIQLPPSARWCQFHQMVALGHPVDFLGTEQRCRVLWKHQNTDNFNGDCKHLDGLMDHIHSEAFNPSCSVAPCVQGCSPLRAFK